MADEQRLKDAKIQVKLDLSGARRDLDEAEGERSGPGGRKPSPGRKDERKRREDDRRKEQARGKDGRTVLAAGAAGAAGLGAKVVPFIKGLILANVNAALGDILEGAIDKRLATLEKGDTARELALEAARIASLPAQLLADVRRKASQGIAFLKTFPSVFAGQALAQQAAFGRTSAADASAVAQNQAQVAVIEAFMRGEQLRLAGRLKGAVTVDLADSLKKFMVKRFGTNR
jgi:hypothetical protein